MISPLNVSAINIDFVCQFVSIDSKCFGDSISLAKDFSQNKKSSTTMLSNSDRNVSFFIIYINQTSFSFI